MRSLSLRLQSVVAFIAILACAFGMAQSFIEVVNHEGGDEYLVQFFLCQWVAIIAFCVLNDAQRKLEYKL